MTGARAVLVLLVAVAPVVAAGCADGHGLGEAARPATASSPVAAGPAVPHLLADLRSVPFRSPLPPHLRARGAGTWTYIDAGHAGSGYSGSAQILIRSSIEGETITAIYDVFTAASQAAARFKVAESNFSRYGPGGGFSVLHLSPAVSAFCGSQAGPASTTTTCWFSYKATNGNVTTTTPPDYSGDGPAVLQAMLSHLLALTG